MQHTTAWDCPSLSSPTHPTRASLNVISSEDPLPTMSQFHSSMELLLGCYNPVSPIRLLVPGGTLVLSQYLQLLSWVTEKRNGARERTSQETSEPWRVRAIVLTSQGLASPCSLSPALFTLSSLLPRKSLFSCPKCHSDTCPKTCFGHSTYLPTILSGDRAPGNFRETALLPLGEQFQWSSRA